MKNFGYAAWNRGGKRGWEIDCGYGQQRDLPVRGGGYEPSTTLQ